MKRIVKALVAVVLLTGLNAGAFVKPAAVKFANVVKNNKLATLGVTTGGVVLGYLANKYFKTARCNRSIFNEIICQPKESFEVVKEDINYGLSKVSGLFVGHNNIFGKVTGYFARKDKLGKQAEPLNPFKKEETKEEKKN